MKEGRYVQACANFESSVNLDPLLGTILNLAVCQERVGHLVAARASVAAFLARATPDDDRVAKARALEADLADRTPSLRFTFVRTPPTDFKAFIDGAEIAQAQWQTPLIEDPGIHRVRAAAPGYIELSFEIDLAEGSRTQKFLDLEPLEKHAPRNPLRSPKIEEQKASPGARRLPTTFYVTAGVAVVSLATAGVSGGLVLFERHRVDSHCVAKSCDPEGLDAGRRGTTFATINTVSLPLAAGAGAAALYLFFTAQDSLTAKPGLRVAVDPLRIALVLQGSY